METNLTIFVMPCHNLNGIVGRKNATNCLDDKNDSVCREGETRFEYEEGNYICRIEKTL